MRWLCLVAGLALWLTPVWLMLCFPFGRQAVAITLGAVAFLALAMGIYLGGLWLIGEAARRFDERRGG